MLAYCVVNSLNPHLHEFFTTFLLLLQVLIANIGVGSYMVECPAVSELAGFQVEELVSATETTAVFRATELKTGRQVALKTLQPCVEFDGRGAAQLNREARACRLLDHDSIAKVATGGSAERLYVAREWSLGASLREVIAQEGNLSFERAVWIAMELCVALQHMHSRGVAHCNLRPENIYLDGQDRIRIVNFEYASVAGELEYFLPEPSPYMSPEQLQGKPGNAQSDLYAVGSILFEMVTGRKLDRANRLRYAAMEWLPKGCLRVFGIDMRDLRLILNTAFRAADSECIKRHRSASDLALDLICHAHKLPERLKRAPARERTS
jgi:eukaryotic-like serine/threonine-protein kinase